MKDKLFEDDRGTEHDHEPDARPPLEEIAQAQEEEHFGPRERQQREAIRAGEAQRGRLPSMW